MDDRQRLADLIREKALARGDFTLASGKKSSFYLDCRKVTLDAQGVSLIGAAMLGLIEAEPPDLVGGMAIGADPIVASILTIAGQRGMPLRGVLVRKEPKQHGAARQVEGPFREGDRIVIVEDVVTTGGSSLRAIELCRAEGIRVERVLAIVDRQEGGREAFAAAGLGLTALFTVDELLGD